MNGFDAKTKATPHGHIGLFRCVHRAAYREVCENGRVRFFADKKDAQIAADEALRNHMNSDLTSWGETLSTTLSAKKQLDQLFMGGGKVVSVERKAVKA